MTTTSRLRWYAIMLAVAVACAPRPTATAPRSGVRGEAQGDGGLAGKTCYLAQLHLHGQSNHNGNALPASMESQAYEAKLNGFDVIWWTDHAELFGDFQDLRISFATSALDSAGNIILRSRMGRRVSGFAVEKPAGTQVVLKDGAVLAGAKGQPGSSEFRAVSLTPMSRLGAVRSIEFCRPVTSGLSLEADLAANGLGPDTYLRFIFDFSWHPTGQHHAVFEAVSGPPAAPVAVGDTTVMHQFVLPEAGPVVFDLAQALKGLISWDDNVLSSFTIEAGARDGGAIETRLAALSLRSEEPLGIKQFATVKTLAKRYDAEFGIVSHIGVEIGKVHTPRSPHMNAYLPERAETVDGLAVGIASVRRDWVEEIHRQRGLVSFNHPFGASRNPRTREGSEDEDYEDMPSAEPPRELAARGASATEEEFSNLARALVEEKAFGADMLEVGYLYRGVGSLEDHLRLWDLALANGVHLVGTGTSDSHGGIWGPDMLPNPFASWIWSAGVGADDLIAALRRGHVAFGDPFNWRGEFALLAAPGDGKGLGGEGLGGKGGTGTAMMGDTLRAPAGTTVTAWVYMDPPRNDIDVVAIQTKMQRSDRIEQTRQTLQPGPPAYRFSVAVGESSLVRVEVRAKDGTPLVFSNPIYLFPVAEAGESEPKESGRAR